VTVVNECIVCGEFGTESTLSTCHVCGQEFHLNERNDQEGRDCGQVWIDEQYMALRFACQRCLDGEASSSPTEERRPARAARQRRRYRRRDG
jgi:hypothetical protein